MFFLLPVDAVGPLFVNSSDVSWVPIVLVHNHSAPFVLSEILLSSCNTFIST